MFEKMSTSFVSSVHGFLNVCVVIAGYHNHIIKGCWKLKYILGGGGGLLANAPIYPV